MTDLTNAVVVERNQWREQMIKDTFKAPEILNEYLEHRQDPYWRASATVEKLCEYILFLEELVVANAPVAAPQIPDTLYEEYCSESESYESPCELV